MVAIAAHRVVLMSFPLSIFSHARLTLPETQPQIPLTPKPIKKALNKGAQSNFYDALLIRNRFSGARAPARLPVRVRTQTG